MVAVTVPPARSTTPCRAAGRTLIAVATVAAEGVSVIVTTVPTGNKPWVTQNPAGTVKLAPAMTKVKLVNGSTPGPAILQTFKRPTPPAVFVKSTSVIPAPMIAVTVPAERLTIPWLAAGSTLISDTIVPLEGVSTTVTVAPTGK